MHSIAIAKVHSPVSKLASWNRKSCNLSPSTTKIKIITVSPVLNNFYNEKYHGVIMDYAMVLW